MLSSWSAQLIDEAPTGRKATFRLMRCSSSASDVQHYRADARPGVEERLADRIAKAVAADELPPDGCSGPRRSRGLRDLRIIHAGARWRHPRDTLTHRRSGYDA